MIRLLLLTVVPLILPFAVWYLWNVFGKKPQLDPSTGEQEPPEITSAPLKMLTFVGVLLSLLTLGGFLFSHDQTVSAPYSPIKVDDAAKELDRGIAPDRPTTSR